MKLLIEDYPILVLPQLAVKIGLNEAIVLQQIQYWIKKYEKDPQHLLEGNIWIWNTIETWNEQFPFWSISTIKRIFKFLEEKKLIVAFQMNAVKHDHTKWYRIDYNSLESLLSLESVKLTQSKVSN